jgi:hypothetical protein
VGHLASNAVRMLPHSGNGRGDIGFGANILQSAQTAKRVRTFASFDGDDLWYHA